MSTCPIFERQINFKIINCRKTTGKQSIKRQRLWLNNLLIVIQSLHRKVKHPLSFLFSENRENYVISIFNISFLFLKIAIRLASQNSLQDTKFLNCTNFFAFLTSRLSNKNIASGFPYQLMNFGLFSSDVTRISETVICSIDRLTQIRHITAFCVSNWIRPEDGWRLLNPTTETAIMRISIMVRSLLALFGQCIG